jgi:lysophospholipase L1-like esterase
MNSQRIIFFLTGTLLLASGSWTGASSLIDHLAAGKQQTLVLYGTSETQIGAWADTVPGHGGLSDWLTSKYGNRVTVINSGVSGRASNTGLSNLNSKVFAYHPDTVLIEFAMNDAKTNYPPTDVDYNITLAKCASNLNTMIDRIWATNSHTEIILQTMNSIFNTNGFTYATARPNLAGYYQVYRDVAAARGVQLIDHYVNWEALRMTNAALYRSYLPDGLHPNATGSLAITLPAVEQALLLPGLRVTSVAFSNAFPAISFTTLNGPHYRLERKTNLTDASWTPVTGSTNIAGTGGTLQRSDPEAGAGNLPHRFYRIKQLP